MDDALAGDPEVAEGAGPLEVLTPWAGPLRAIADRSGAQPLDTAP